jgi:hypothetical protein
VVVAAAEYVEVVVAVQEVLDQETRYHNYLIHSQ